MFAAGDKVSWWHTPACKRHGVVVEPSERLVGVRPAGERELLYVDACQLYSENSPIPLEDGVYAGIPTSDYQSDRDSLSASGARLLLSAPAKYAWQLDHPREPATHFDIGTLVHTLVLGCGDEIEVVDAEDWRSKHARECRDKARETGRVPILRADYDAAVDMRDAVKIHHRLAAELFDAGEPEMSMWVRDPATGVRLRARPDWMTQRDGRLWLVDLKTCQSADPREFGRTANHLGYHVQMAWYVTVARLLELDPNPVFLFVLVEKTPPHLVSVVELDADAYQLGYRRMREAIDVFRACRDWDEWPGYAADSEIVPVALPQWVFRHQGKESQ
ncbi:PD-(D/E)XK nuclease-like domain-containing protein [Mycobacterium xenopi]|uniref:Putative exodeoxyribonuclease 8 PDDEXK-like domain-containing protein n=1 Tax=Mycobacterium xenopi TaxID=1789 RepID=A0AAD1H0C5_MYCXE|nr:PD-(D/E)XK nuclease-like domain-containing protein [Mycobacterium xenopi]ORX21622.1 hypothetical protein AWC32_21670 [Mycobacterium xenopi]BBU22136.1 hypothetical protein MYXE_19260 [Mycobacterium xenopi]SPX77974.1 gp60 protein [Mycobacterium xenopi]